MIRSRAGMVMFAVLLSVGAGAAWGVARPGASAAGNRQAEFGQVHVRDPKAASGGEASAAIKAKWVVAENAKPGTTDWRITNSGSNGEVEGYADKVSAVLGDTVGFYVSTTSSAFRIEAYRIGSYQGLGGRLVWRSPSLPGVKQAKSTRDSQTNMVEAPWNESLRLTLTSAFPPGVYLFKLVSGTGKEQFVPLTIRDDRSTSAFLVQNSVTTWQAYNLWGGYDLYEGRSGSRGSDFQHRSRIVSFDRPYAMGAGSGDFLGNEFPLISLMESQGLDVSYWTDVDLHERPQLLQHHRALLSLGHDEYWSTVMRRAAENARDRGVNIAFLGANALFRHIRLDRSSLGPSRHVIDYKQAREDPLFGKNNKEVTSDWRAFPVSEPESSLIGNYYECNPAKADLVVADSSAWVFAGTGLTTGDRLKNVVGPEYDRHDTNAPGPTNVQVLAHSPLRCGGRSSYSDMTYYTASSGAGVFATGTNWWISKLSEDCPPNLVPCPKDSVVRITENVLGLFGVGPAGQTHPSVATNYHTLPTATVPSTASTTYTRRYPTRTTSPSSRQPSSTFAPRTIPTTPPTYPDFTPPPTYQRPTPTRPRFP